MALSSAAATALRPPGYWGVRDSNARELDADGNLKPRIHEAGKGRVYALYFDRDTFMPEEHARKFLKDVSWEVTDAEGDIVAPLARQSLSRRMPDALAPGVVIASLEELTQEALLTRAAQRPRTPKFTAETKRDLIISFLYDEFERDAMGEDPSTGMANPATNSPGMPRLEAGLGADDVDQMDEDETKKLLAGV